MEEFNNLIYNNSKIQLEMLYLENFVCFDKLTLNFNPEKYCFIINGSSNSKTQICKSTIFLAFKFIFHTEFIDSNESRKLLKKHSENGHVKTETSSQIEAIRTFDNPTKIYIIKNNVEKQLNFKYFLAQYTNSLWDFNYENIKDNDNLLDDFYKSLWQSNKYYESDMTTIVKNEFISASITDDHVKTNIFNNLLLRNEALAYQDVLRWKNNPENMKTFTTVAKTVNEVFNKLTYKNYSVKFLMPSHSSVSTNLDDFTEIDTALSLEHWNENIKTVIVSLYNHPYIIWTKIEHHLILLLKLSAQIALSMLYNHNIIIIENLSDLELSQNEELFKTAMIMNYFSKNQSERDNLSLWEYKNFSQKIIEVCQENKILAIVLFNDYVSVKDTNIIHCEAKKGTHFKCDVKGEMINIEHILKHFNELVNT